MGADMLTNTFFTGTNFKQPENLRELIVDSLVDDDRLAQIWDGNGDVHVEQWPGQDGGDMLDRPVREDVIAKLVTAFEDFYKGLDSRDVTYSIWKDPTTGVEVCQWLTGGMSWGDWPTEVGQEWYDLLDDQVTGLAPELPAKLGIYYNPFVAALALAARVGNVTEGTE